MKKVLTAVSFSLGILGKWEKPKSFFVLTYLRAHSTTLENSGSKWIISVPQEQFAKCRGKSAATLLAAQLGTSRNEFFVAAGSAIILTKQQVSQTPEQFSPLNVNSARSAGFLLSQLWSFLLELRLGFSSWKAAVQNQLASSTNRLRGTIETNSLRGIIHFAE